MKLPVALIAHSRYWRAGEEVPDDQVPEIIRNKYVMRASRDDGKPSPLASSKHAGKARKPSKR
jgi:hypothetical protein